MMAGSSAAGMIPLFRVTSENLDPNKNWYLLTEQVCCNKAPFKFLENSIFDEFQGEVSAVDPNELKDDNGCQIPKTIWPKRSKTGKVYVASAFGLISGLLRQQKPALVKKLSFFTTVMDEINDMDLRAQLSSSCSAHGPPSRSVTPSPSTSFKSSFNPHFTSTPLSKRNSVSSTNIKAIERNDNLRPATKKRKIREEARKSFANLQTFLAEHEESLGTVMGECCVNDPVSKPSEARETIKEVFDRVCAAKGADKAFKLLISEDALEKRIKNFRVPDWQLLLLKIEARISDNGFAEPHQLDKFRPNWG